MVEALADFRRRATQDGVMKTGQFPALSERWARMIFHLPYAFHAKRMFVEQFVTERMEKGSWDKDVQKFNLQIPDISSDPDPKNQEKAKAAFMKSVSESALYKQFVAEKLEKAQRASQETGNLYTASIFLALMSTLECDLAENTALDKKRFGFIAYGSGSKAKVFEATVQKDWQNVVRHFKVFEKIAQRQAIDYDQYEALHKGTQQTTVLTQKGRWALDHIGQEGVTLGARYYEIQA